MAKAPKKRGRQPLGLSPSRPLGGRGAVERAAAASATVKSAAAKPAAPKGATRVAEPRAVAGGREPVAGANRRQPGRATAGGGLPKFARVAFLVVFVYLFGSFALQEFEVMRLSAQVRDLENQSAQLGADNQRLADDIKYAQTPQYIERIAREELGLVWPNEIPYAAGGQPASGTEQDARGSSGP